MDISSLDATQDTGTGVRNRELGISVKQAPFEEAYAKANPCFEEHWTSVKDLFAGFSLSPNLEMYRRGVAAGMCSCFVLEKDDDKELVGYATIVHGPHRFLSGSIATLDMVFIKKEWRSKGLATRLMEKILAYCVESGFSAFIIPTFGQWTPLAIIAKSLQAKQFETTYIIYTNDLAIEDINHERMKRKRDAMRAQDYPLIDPHNIGG